MRGSLEDHFLVIRIPWLNKVITYLRTYLKLRKIVGILLSKVESTEELANLGDYPGDFML